MVVFSDDSVSLSLALVSVVSLVSSLLDDPDTEPIHVLALPLTPLEVVVCTATLLPACSDILWNEAALATLVDCHTLASKLATAPVLYYGR